MVTCSCFKAKKGQAECNPKWLLEMITNGLLPNPGSTTCSIFSQLSHDSSKKLVSNCSSQPSLPDVLAKNWPLAKSHQMGVVDGQLPKSIN